MRKSIEVIADIDRPASSTDPDPGIGDADGSKKCIRLDAHEASAYAPVSCAGQPPEAKMGADPVEEELLARELERRDALIGDDVERLSLLLADDLVHVHTTGISQSKGELLEHVFGFLKFLNVERGPLTIRPIGDDAAIMTGSMTNTVQRRGFDESVQVQAFVTQVWQKRNDVWLIRSFHATRLPEQSS